MPYIAQSFREDIDNIFKKCEPSSLQEFISILREYHYPAHKMPGILNYIITSLIGAFVVDDKNYNTINAAIGVLECAKFELYRRIAAGYEDNCINKNGDIDCYKE